MNEQKRCVTCRLWHEIDQTMFKNTPQGLARLRIHTGICLAFVEFLPIDSMPGACRGVTNLQCGPQYGCPQHKMVEEVIVK